MNCDPYKSSNSFDLSNNDDLKRNDETMQDPHTKRDDMIDLVVRQENPEENKSNYSLNKENNATENNLLKQTTLTIIEYQTNKEYQQKRGPANLSIPYSPGLLLQHKKFPMNSNSDKGPFLKDAKLLELTKFDLQAINQEYQELNKESLKIEKNTYNSGNGKSINHIPLNLEEDQLGG